MNNIGERYFLANMAKKDFILDPTGTGTRIHANKIL